MELAFLKGVDAFPGVGEDSILAARRGRRGHRRGAPSAPAASQLSAPELPRLYTAILARRLAWVVATSGLTASPEHAGGGWGARAGGGRAGDRRRAARRSRGLRRLQGSRATESPACAPGPGRKLVCKGSLWFFFFFFPSVGTKTN